MGRGAGGRSEGTTAGGESRLRRPHRLPPADAYGDASGCADHRHRQASEPVGADLRVRVVCAAQRGLAAIARSRRGARRGVRRGSGGGREVDGGRTRSAKRAKGAKRCVLCGLCGLRVRSSSVTADSFPPSRSHRAASALALRDAADARWPATAGRLHRGEPRMPSSLPALSRRTGLPGAVPRRAAGHRAGRRGGADRRGRRAHHVRRSRFFQRPDARDANRVGDARGVSGGQLRRDDQGRAPPAPPRSGAPAGGHRLRVRDERDRIGRRSRAGAPRQGAHARGFLPGGRVVS